MLLERCLKVDWGLFKAILRLPLRYEAGARYLWWLHLETLVVEVQAPCLRCSSQWDFSVVVEAALAAYYETRSMLTNDFFLFVFFVNKLLWRALSLFHLVTFRDT